MAATQAEPQQNDVNRDIVPQEQSPSSANNSLQNGTDKSSGRGVVGSDAGGGKGMKPAQNISVDMSQYRQDSGPPVNNSEQNANNSDDNVSKVNNTDKPYGHNAEQSASDVNYSKCPPESGPNMQGYGLSFPQRGNFMHPESVGIHMVGEPGHHSSNSYGHFGPSMRHQYPGSKPLVRPGFQQQRIMPSQGMSSPPAGTPTLNQLLQSNSAHNRYPNSYGEYGMPKGGEQPPPAAMPYNQNWPPPRPMPPYTQQNPPYRNQPPPGAQGGGNTVSSQSGGGSTGTQQQSQSSGGGNSQPGQVQSSGSGGGQQPGPGQQPPPRSYPGYPPSPSHSPYHPSQSPYRHPYQQMGGGGGSNGGYDRGGSWSPGPGGAAPPQHDHPSSPQQPPSSQQQQQQPTSQQHQSSFQSRGAQQSPNAHGPDPAELTGQNSNDSSSGGGGGGTPNSGGGPLRPSPSPTGSSGSRSMSPAVLPPVGSSQQGNQQQNQGGQSQQAPPPSQSQQLSQQSVVMPPRPPSGQSDSGNGPSRLSHSPMAQPSLGHGPMQQGPPAGYQGPGPQHYKMGPNAPAGPSLMSHMPSPSIPPQSQQIPPYSPQPPHHQYPQQISGNYRSGPMGSYVGPGYPGGPPQSQYPPHRPPIPNHVQYPPYQQHKVGGYPPSPGTYSSQAMGPPSLHPGMPPPPPPHHDGPMPPPASTPSDLHDTPSTTSSQTGTVTSSSSSSSNIPPGVTSIVTTGPDASLDEASQQSTLSNASAASGDDTSVTTPSKVRGVTGKENMVYQSSHPTTPQSTAPSPGTASLNSIHEEYPPDNSPTWSRTPNSPVQMFNSHVSQDLYRPKKHDSLSKLYEMDESVERRMWLDKLLQYMEDKGTPISTCPTISKNPLDLFRLYVHVKERGGFMEVCKVTKNKVWKDIAGLLGIGASSSAAYTLRKHYTKNLLPFECYFDRGGIDPQPIISQVEASSKKKTTKTAPVPSPGSSNSQDSFQGPGSGGMDGYPGYGYPQDYNNQRPPSQSNQGVQQGYGGSYGQFGEQYGQGYGGYPGRPVYSGYPDAERGYAGTQQDQYRYMGGGAYPGRNYPTPPAPTGSPATPPQTAGTSPAPPPAQSPAAQPDYYRAGGEYPSNQQYPPTGGKGMPPPQPGPRRHPDFVKDQPQPPQSQPPPPAQPPYPPYSQTPHRPPPPNIYPGWTNSSGGQFRGQYPGTTSSGPPGWGSNSRPGTPGSGQWTPSSGYQPGWAPSQPRPPRPQHPGGCGLRPPHDPQQQPPTPQNNKQYHPIAPPPGAKVSGSMTSSYGSCKRELIFPEGSVEGTSPVMYKRRRLCKSDVAPVDAWRIMMCLKSGLLAETTWALDVLNILLFDDTTVQYFGLLHLPGLLDILLEHMKVALQEMLEPCDDKPCEDPVDLGSVLTVPDPFTRTTLLHRTPDMTLRSRKGHPVSLVPAQDDLFVTDARRPWDPEDSPDRDHPDMEQTKYIISTFKSEICNIPFTRKIPGLDKSIEEIDESSFKESSPFRVTVPIIEDSKPCDRICKKKNKSLSFALSRIKKENVEDEKIEEPVDKEEIKVKTEREEAENEEDDDNDEDREDDESREKEISVKEEVFNIKIKDPAGTLKRRRMSDYEDECYNKDEASLYLITESQDWLAKRCICISTILRNLTFVPGNEAEYSKSSTFLSLVGKLLLLHHEHLPRKPKQRNYDRDVDADTGDSCSSLAPSTHWWWDFLHHLRENALVSLANICGQVDLGLYPEEVSRPILDGLLHWAVCPAAHGQDPFPTVSPMSSLSPQRLALEALCKLCVTDSNVDLVIATPPYCRLERLSSVLTRLLCRSEEQVLREFGVNLLFYLGAADSSMARTIALQTPCISLLVGFIEQAESGAVAVANASGLGALRENPDQAMGTSVDMVRRACRALLALSRHPSNRPLIQQHEQRLLHLVMSQVLDQSAAQTLARVLYQVSRPNPPSTPPPPPPPPATAS